MAIATLLAFLLLSPATAPKAASAPTPSPQPWTLQIRRQMQPGFPWGDRTLHDVGWETIETTRQLDPDKCLIVVVDMIRFIPTAIASEYGAMLAVQMNKVLHDARARGIHVLFCPANTDDEGFYNGHPAREMMRNLPNHADPPLKYFGAQPWEKEHFSLLETGSWETPESDLPWDWRQTETLDILPGDGLTELGPELWNYLIERDIQHVIVMGLVTNYCVLNRPFAIRTLQQAGVDVLLCRDLTFVSAGIRDNLVVDGHERHLCHDLMTDACVEFIEKYWCPSFSRNDLLLDPPSPPATIVDCTFQDGDLFFERGGYEDFRLGGGLYNLSFDNDGRYPSLPSAAASESAGCLQLRTRDDWDPAITLTRRPFPYRPDNDFDGTRIEWRLKSVNGFLSGPHPGQGLCLGVIDALGDVTATAPTRRTDATQIYLAIRDHDADGLPDGELCLTDSAGYNQPIPTTTFQFDQWRGHRPLTVTATISESSWHVQFSESFNQGRTEISGPLPPAFQGVQLLHAFTTLQDNTAHTVQLDRLLVQRCSPAGQNREPDACPPPLGVLP